MSKLKTTIFLFFITFLFFGQPNDSINSANTSSSKFTEAVIYIDENDTLNKVHFETNFQTKYNTPEFDYEVKIPKKNWWDRFQDWLSFILDKIFSFSNIQESLYYTQITLKVIGVIIFLIVVYFITKLILNKEGNWIFGKSVKNKIEYDDLEQNLTKIDFEKLIEQTKDSQNKRLAIRYYYLWVLKKLTEKEFIDFNPEKTNSDYYNELKIEKMRDDFKYVSYLYNNIWYGEFEIFSETFEKAQESFKKMLQSI